MARKKKLLQTKKARAARARYRKNKKKRRTKQKGEGFFEDVGSFFTQNVLPVLPTLLPILL